MSGDTPTQDEIDDDDGGYDPEEDELDDCMLGPDGQCGMAGSEWCDFQCPMRDSEFYAGSEAWKRRRKKATP